MGSIQFFVKSPANSIQLLEDVGILYNALGLNSKYLLHLKAAPATAQQSIRNADFTEEVLTVVKFKTVVRI